MSGFVDDGMFLHNGENGPQSKTTHIFRSVRDVATLGAKSVVSDCILFTIFTPSAMLITRCQVCTVYVFASGHGSYSTTLRAYKIILSGILQYIHIK